MSPLDRLDNLCQILTAALNGISATAPGSRPIDLTFIEAETQKACIGLTELPAGQQRQALERLQALSTLLTRCQSHVETRLGEIDGSVCPPGSQTRTERG